MSLKQMMDAAEARANVQRERKLELSPTQTRRHRKQKFEEGALLQDQQPPLLTGSAHCPARVQRQEGQPVARGAISGHRPQGLRTYKPQGTGWPKPGHLSFCINFAMLLFHLS